MTPIRPFRRSDLSRVLEIERASFQEDAYTQETFLEYFRSGEALFAVAARPAHAVGYIVTSLAGAEAEIVSIAVDPSQRRLGLGAALITYALRQLRARRCRHVELAVRTTNAAAIRLYRRFGFKTAGRIRRYYEDGADAWLMARKL